MDSNCLFYSNYSPKPKDIRFTVIHDREKYQILTFEKLGPENVWHFGLKVFKSIIKWLLINFPVKQLTNYPTYYCSSNIN